MKLYEIAQADTYKIELSEDRAVALIAKNCQHALKFLVTPIVRGMTGMHGYNENQTFMLVHGAAGERSSTNTSNHYTVILDKVLPPLGYPKRGSSIICGNFANRDHANNYGDLYAILPFDGTPIGVCPDFDMWGTPITLGDTTHDISDWNDIFVEMGVPEDVETFGEIIDTLVEIRANPDENEAEFPWLFNIGEGKAAITQAFLEAYSKPFKLISTDNKAFMHTGFPKEFWIGGKCIAISMDKFRAMREKLEKL